MMPVTVRIAVIADIHANLQALEAVLGAIDAERPEALWCLGDTVGYGPRPNECCALVRERADLCLVGNHDLAALGALEIDDFSPDAAAAALWTAGELSGENRTFLESLEPSARVERVELHHASPRHPIWEYVLTHEVAQANLEVARCPLVLVGHSHVALALVLEDGLLAGGLAPAGTERELERGRWLLNPGSVGQPRDGDPRAAWLLLDLERRFAEFRRAPYPVERTQEELRDRGLPETLAARLAFGQ
jgi:diadenosine tetraphosphatase ApaH/serine/threonine PP2A family protein phosphatase